WKKTNVKQGVASDPYLIGFYDKRSLTLSHDLDHPVEFTIEVEPIGHGPWMTYQKVKVQPGKPYVHTFPSAFQARWIRFTADQDCEATAWLKYE
ncbi:MAG TPA: hypothetical protein VFT90_10175, partial [Chryseosolibacter sp.]|nr:hypothetical protein [Chryseosolibacter sp.]